MYAVQVKDDESRSLVWEETVRPELHAGQVLVRVHATALNRADLLQRRGLYPPPRGASHIMGLEAAGEIVACADDVEGWSVGDGVCVLLEGGGYAQYIACDAGMLLPRPSTMSWEQAAALPEVYYTAYLNLAIEGALQKGERVLVHAGASGVGTAVIQLCKEWGNPVLATASAGKLDFLEGLGARATFDRRREDLFEAIGAYTETLENGSPGAPKGVDLVFDPVGGHLISSNMRLLRNRGRLVLIGLLGGADAQIDLRLLLMRRLRLIGSVLRSRTRAEKLVITKRMRADVWPLFESGRLAPIIHKTFEIEEVEEAHRMMASNENIGKIVLRVGAE